MSWNGEPGKEGYGVVGRKEIIEPKVPVIYKTDRNMKRKEMLEIVNELMEKLNEKKISPMEAEMISEVLLDEVKKANESGRKKYMERGTFCGSLPEK